MKKVIPLSATLIPDTSVQVFCGVIYDVYQWKQKLFDGTQATFEMLRRPDTVTAICIVNNKVIVIDDVQPHRGSRLTFPGGRVDKGEGVSEAIKRETHEETGYEFKNWRLVKVWQPQTKIEKFEYLFIAWDGAKTAAPHLDSGEKITIELLPFNDLIKKVFANEGYLGEVKDLFEHVANFEQLLSLPKYKGKEVNR